MIFDFQFVKGVLLITGIMPGYTKADMMNFVKAMEPVFKGLPIALFLVN